MTNYLVMSYNIYYNILNTKTVLRKDTILKIITKTLLIATLFTSSIIASQGCTGTKCMASFGKQADIKVVATNASFKTNVIPTIIQAEYIETQEMINIVEERSYVEESFFPEEIITSPFEPIIVSEETINPLKDNIENNIQIATILDDKPLNTEPYCEESQGTLTCDITGDTSECTCA